MKLADTPSNITTPSVFSYSARTHRLKLAGLFNSYGRTQLQSVITFILLVGISMAELPPYKPRGWRPNQPFSPHRNQFTSYGPPSVQNYGPPEVSISLPAITTTTTTTTTTTEAPNTTPNIPTTTPSRSPEPTTPSSVTEEDFESNPALAIANSFAFNRPVYVYNSFPYYSGYTLLK